MSPITARRTVTMKLHRVASCAYELAISRVGHGNDCVDHVRPAASAKDPRAARAGRLLGSSDDSASGRSGGWGAATPTDCRPFDRDVERLLAREECGGMIQYDLEP